MSDNISVSKVYFEDEEALWSYYNNCGLSPALKVLDGGPLNYRKVTYSLGDMFVCSTASTSGWGFEKQQNTDVYFVSFTHRGESRWEMNKQGKINASQQLCIIDSSQLVQGQFSRETLTDTVMINASSLKKELEALQGFACHERLEFKSLLPPDAKVWPMLGSIIQCMRTLLMQNEELPSPFAVSYLKQALMSTLIEAAPHNYSHLGKVNARSVFPRHLARAIDYIHAHANEDIVISDVAQFACTSVRNLQLGFRLYKNSTPMQYLREVRLLSAHKDILDPDVRRTWQAIARAWGFSDVDSFSRYYNRRFGETPFRMQLKIKGRLDHDF